MRQHSAIVLCFLTVAVASGTAIASTPVPAVDLGVTAFSPSAGRDVNAGGRILVQGPAALDGLPFGVILLPPQPGGGELVLPCSGLLSCFHETDVPSGLNAGGRVIGRRIGFASPGTVRRPATWSANGSVATLLLPFPGPFLPGGQARHLNTGEVIVGVLANPSGFVDAPVFWSSPAATPTMLANLGTSAGPYPVRISDGGVIIGDRAGATPRAVLWSSTAAPSFAYLGELPGGATSHARDLDETGRIVGSSDAGSGTQAAVLWRPSGGGHTVETLPVPFAGGSCQVATAIEAGGWIVGNCTNAAGDRRGVIWRDIGGVAGVVHELLPLSGDSHSAAQGLAGAAIAVGSSGDTERAVFWDLAAAAPIAVPMLSAPGLVLLVASLVASALRARTATR